MKLNFFYDFKLIHCCPEYDVKLIHCCPEFDVKLIHCCPEFDVKLIHCCPEFDVKLIHCCPEYDVKLICHHQGNDIVRFDSYIQNTNTHICQFFSQLYTYVIQLFINSTNKIKYMLLISWNCSSLQRNESIKRQHQLTRGNSKKRTAR